jgi:hypothetical protein
MRFSKWSHEVVLLVIVIAVFAIAFSNSAQFTGMIVSDQQESPSNEEVLPSLEEGCKYVDVPYTENACTEYQYNYTIRYEQFLNSRYGYEHVCTGVVWIDNHDAAGWWEVSYIFEIDGATYKAENDRNYILSGESGRFIFEHLCEEGTEFDGIYYIEEEPIKTICGPITKYKKEVKCGLQEE